MGTSLSGLTPATTFDGLLKVGDNDPLDGTLKAISTGDGADTILQLSTTALQIGGATGMYWDNTNSRLGVGTDSPNTKFEVNGSIRSSGDGTQIFEFSNATLGQFRAVFGSVGFRLGSGMFVGGADGGPAANTRLHIKGSGANADTTSLLVQNSAGAQLLKINDDGSGFFGTYLQGQRIYAVATGETFPSLSFAGSSGTGMFQPTSGSNVIGFAVSGGEKARLDATGLGIGEITPTARLHIKGEAPSGDPLNNPTALLVQNSAGSDILTIKDDRSFKISSDAGTVFNIDSNGSQAIGTSSRATLFNGSSTSFLRNVGIGESALAARLHVKGEAPSGDPLNNPTALLVENSAGTDLFKLQDDGDLNIKSNSGIFATTSNVNLFSYSSGGGGVLDVNPSNSNSVKLRVRGANDVYLIETNPANDAVGIGLTSANAKLHIKGSAPVEDPPGTFTNPTALLVQNSAGADLLKVENAGTIGMTGFTIESNIIKPRVNGFIGISRNDNRTFSIGDSNASRTYLNIQSSSTSNFADVSVNTDHLVVKKEGNVAVGTSTLDASAKLQVDSTTQGFLPPRMTFDQRNAITAPAVGLIVYQTDGDEGVYVNTSTGWKQMQLIG